MSSFSTYSDSSGNTWKRDGGGWRQLDGAEEIVQEESQGAQIYGAAKSAALHTTGMLTRLAGVLGQQGTMMGASQIQQMGDTDLATEMRQQAAITREQASSAADAMQADADTELGIRQFVAPGATAVGEYGQLAIEMAATGDLAAVSGLARGSYRVARNALRRAPVRKGGPRTDILSDGTEIVLRDDELSRSQVGAIGKITEDLYGDSVGARRAMSDPEESARFVTRLAKVPGMKSGIESMQKFLNQTRNLTGDQRELLQSGAAERLGFKWLPGQDIGNNIVSEGMKSQPFVADALQGITSENSDSMTKYVMRSLDLDGELIGRDILDRSDKVFEQEFSAVAASIGDMTLDDDLFKRISDDALTKDSQKAFSEMREAGEKFTGNDIMQMRSAMNKEAAARWRLGEERAAQNVYEAMNHLDAKIAQQLGPDGMSLWRDTQQRYRVRRAIENTINADGEVSLKGLATSLSRHFKGEYKNKLFAPRDGTIPDDVADLMDYTKLARAFESNLGDSGTATRTAIGKIFSGPKGWTSLAYQRAGADAITWMMTSGTDIAKATAVTAP